MQVFFVYMEPFSYLCLMKETMKNWLFTKTNSEAYFNIDTLKLTSDYALLCLSKMKVGESVVMSNYAIKRLK